MSLAHKLNYYETQVACIWRLGPESKEQSNIIYKINHHTCFVEESVIKSASSYQKFENRYPLFPKSSILYFNINDINYTELQEIYEACLAYKNPDLANALRSTM
jgi:hypothetical protein